jgi:hypothetical protein
MLAGQWIGPDGKVHGEANHTLLAEDSWFLPWLLVHHALDTTHYQLSYVGAETLGSEAVQHFSYWRFSSAPPESNEELKNLSRTEIYIDASSFLPVRITFDEHPDNDARAAIPVEVDYANYQTVNGTLIPYSIRKYRNHSLVLDLTVQSATVNSGINAGLFKLQ